MIIRILANGIIKNELQSEMKLCVYKPKSAKFFLPSIFSLMVCFAANIYIHLFVNHSIGMKNVTLHFYVEELNNKKYKSTFKNLFYEK